MNNSKNTQNTENQFYSILENIAKSSKNSKISSDDLRQKYFHLCLGISDEQKNNLVTRLNKNGFLSIKRGGGYTPLMFWIKTIMMNSHIENGLLPRIMNQDKQLANVLGWSDEQRKEFAECVDYRVVNGNRIYYLVDMEGIFRDFTFNGNKVVKEKANEKKGLEPVYYTSKNDGKNSKPSANA